MLLSPPASYFVKPPQLPLYTLRMRTNATRYYESEINVALLLHNKRSVFSWQIASGGCAIAACCIDLRSYTNDLR